MAERGLKLELDLIENDQYDTTVNNQLAAGLDYDFVYITWEALSPHPASRDAVMIAAIKAAIAFLFILSSILIHISEFSAFAIGILLFQGTQNAQLKYAMIIFTSLPVLCTYPFFQKYFIKGMVLGSLKE